MKTFLEFTGYYPPINQSWMPNPHGDDISKKKVYKNIPKIKITSTKNKNGITVDRISPSYSYKKEKDMERPKNRMPTFIR